MWQERTACREAWIQISKFHKDTLVQLHANDYKSFLINFVHFSSSASSPSLIWCDVQVLKTNALHTETSSVSGCSCTTLRQTILLTYASSAHSSLPLDVMLLLLPLCCASWAGPWCLERSSSGQESDGVGYLACGLLTWEAGVEGAGVLPASEKGWSSWWRGMT